MGEYKFSVNSSLSSIEYQSSVNTSGLPSSSSSSQSYFVDDGQQQQPDTTVKQQISPSPVNGDHQQLSAAKERTAKEDSVLAVLSGGDKPSGGPQNMQLPSSYNNDASHNVINSSTNSSTSSLWSASVDDTLIHGLNASAAANNVVSFLDNKFWSRPGTPSWNLGSFICLVDPEVKRFPSKVLTHFQVIFYIILNCFVVVYAFCLIMKQFWGFFQYPCVIFT